MDNREQEASRDPESVGVVLTAAVGDRLVEYATTTLDRAGLLREALGWVATLPPKSPADGLTIDPGPPLRESSPRRWK